MSKRQQGQSSECSATESLLTHLPLTSTLVPDRGIPWSDEGLSGGPLASPVDGKDGGHTPKDAAIKGHYAPKPIRRQYHPRDTPCQFIITTPKDGSTGLVSSITDIHQCEPKSKLYPAIAPRPAPMSTLEMSSSSLHRHWPESLTRSNLAHIKVHEDRALCAGSSIDSNLKSPDSVLHPVHQSSLCSPSSKISLVSPSPSLEQSSLAALSPPGRPLPDTPASPFISRRKISTASQSSIISTSTSASSCLTMTSSSSAPTLATFSSVSTASSSCTTSSLHSSPSLSRFDPGDDFLPKPLRYPRLSKSMAKLTDSGSSRSKSRGKSPGRSVKSSSSQRSLTSSILSTPSSAGFSPTRTSPTSCSIPPTPTSTRSLPNKDLSAVQDLPEMLLIRPQQKSSTPETKTARSVMPLSPTASSVSQSSSRALRHSFASVTSTLFSTEDHTLTDCGSLVSASTSASSTLTSIETDEGEDNDNGLHGTCRDSSRDSRCRVRVWEPESEGGPQAGLDEFPLPSTSTPIRFEAFTTCVETDATPRASNGEHVSPFVDGQQSRHFQPDCLLDRTPKSYLVRSESDISVIRKFPLPPARSPIITNTTQSSARASVEQSPRSLLRAYIPLPRLQEEEALSVVPSEEERENVEESTVLPYLKSEDSLIDAMAFEADESDLDIHAPLVDIALKSRIISPNSRLARPTSGFSSSSSTFSSSTSRRRATGVMSYGQGSAALYLQPFSSPASKRSSTRSSLGTLRPLSTPTRHSGEGWSGSESEEEEFVNALQAISLKRLSTPKLKRIPSLLKTVRANRGSAMKSPTSSTQNPRNLSPLCPTYGDDQRRQSSIPATLGYSSLRGFNSPRTPTSSRSNRFSGQSQTSQLSSGTLSGPESTPLTPCSSNTTHRIRSDSPLLSPRYAERCDSDQSGGSKVADVPHLPRPTRRVEGWGMPEILIDEEWSSADEAIHGWSDDEDGILGVGRFIRDEGDDWLLGERLEE
ncbi:hypothetical protein BD324DRAFT_35455 [Kockovaella imperatae]|uniref:Uncharacterized protein n=1 Tax=Kockovaella imperatae TaxID=4999 RepID=A0A1Y1USQ4_9TREE|nr:hypothetical protein BD324DRAFT_35455 [Kockovaella imperatae]ORX41048.1 hypothetical protein BD324DRAFT_35455 [Kockovaella imperatae]